MNDASNRLGVVILAAGEGTRMRSSRPKVLHEIAGKPLVEHVLDLAASVGAERTVLVLSPDTIDQLRARWGDRYGYAVQAERRGTGHALLQARSLLEGQVERVLVPNGRVIVSGLNPASWWGMRQFRAHAATRLGLGQTRLARLYLPEAGAFIGPWRLCDWLRLLSFEVEAIERGCYRPAVRSERWLQRFDWMDRLGPRWWPLLGAVYFIVAVKRVRGMHLLGPAWRPTRAAAAPAVVARRDRDTPSLS